MPCISSAGLCVDEIGISPENDSQVEDWDTSSRGTSNARKVSTLPGLSHEAMRLWNRLSHSACQPAGISSIKQHIANFNMGV